MSTTQVTSTDHPGSKGPRIHQRKKPPWLASRFKLFAFKRRCTLFHQFLCLVSSERSNFVEGFMEKIGILNHQLQWFHGTHLLVSLALRRQPPALSQIQCRSHKSTEQLLNQSPIYIIYQLKHAKSFNLCMLFWMSPKKNTSHPHTFDNCSWFQPGPFLNCFLRVELSQGFLESGHPLLHALAEKPGRTLLRGSNGGFLDGGTPSYHPFLRNFPWKKTSSYWGTPMTMETPSLMIENHWLIFEEPL